MSSSSSLPTKSSREDFASKEYVETKFSVPSASEVEATSSTNLKYDEGARAWCTGSCLNPKLTSRPPNSGFQRLQCWELGWYSSVCSGFLYHSESWRASMLKSTCPTLHLQKSTGLVGGYCCPITRAPLTLYYSAKGSIELCFEFLLGVVVAGVYVDCSLCGYVMLRANPE